MTTSAPPHPLIKLFLYIPILFLTACASNQTDLVATNRLHSESAPSDQVIISPPRVISDDDTLTISGTITRKPGVDADILGRLVFTISDTNGKTLDQFTTLWDPQAIPTTGDRQATYSIDYGFLPPDATNIKVNFDSDTSNASEFNTHTGGFSSGYPHRSAVLSSHSKSKW